MSETSRFLERLTQEAERLLPAGEAAALLAEAQDHLDASIQARIELGMTPEEAEAEAIAAFGTAQAVGHEAKRREPRIDRGFLLSCLTVVAFWGWVGTIRSLPEWMAVPFVLIAAAVHVSFVLSSVYARRVQFAALGAILVPLWLGWSVKQAADHVYAELSPGDGLYRTQRVGLEDQIWGERDWASRIRREGAVLFTAHEAFLKDGSTLSPSRSASYARDGQLRLFRRASRIEAEAYWNDAAGAAGQREYERSAAALESRAQNLEEAAAAPWWPHVPSEMVFALTEAGGAVLASYSALHLAGWWAGRVLRRRKRRNGTFA